MEKSEKKFDMPDLGETIKKLEILMEDSLFEN